MDVRHARTSRVGFEYERVVRFGVERADDGIRHRYLVLVAEPSLGFDGANQERS